ncbi:MAG: hypothetical protein P9F19_01470 [Candidatus Contendobacter sp.]|nr:hypothetical protein [Candidatus Contendobacter sp.]MDG4556059.1 hypothetical protein [Candidatus Contendobacter sp.]
MTPAIYQQWKRQQTDRLRRERQIAARRVVVAPEPAPEPEPNPEPAPAKKRRPENP